VIVLLALLTAVLVFAPLVLASRRLAQVSKSLDYHPAAFVAARGEVANQRFRRAVLDDGLGDEGLRQLGSALFVGDRRTRSARVNEALAEIDGRIGVGVGVSHASGPNRAVGAVLRLFVYGALLEAALAFAAGVPLRDGAALVGAVAWAAYLWAWLERTTARTAAELRDAVDRWVDRGLGQEATRALPHEEAAGRIGGKVAQAGAADAASEEKYKVLDEDASATTSDPREEGAPPRWASAERPSVTRAARRRGSRRQ
jgi:hypothetical protein